VGNKTLPVRRFTSRSGAVIDFTELGFGTAPLGNLYRAISEEDAQATLQAAWDAGCRYIDTAPLYGHGLSERRIGAALRASPRDAYVLATKVGRRLVPGHDPRTIFADAPAFTPVFDFSYDGVLRGMEESLARLGASRIDVLHVHDPDAHEAEALSGAFRALARLREEGVIGAIGAGMNQSAMLARFVERGLVDCVLLAGRYTLLDQSALADLLPQAEAAGVAVILGGFDRGSPTRPGARYDYATAEPALLARARALAAICERHGVPLGAAALQFGARHPAVASVLVGARSPAEVEQALRWFKLRMVCRTSCTRGCSAMSTKPWSRVSTS
jgi:D-threo-aldose 1-dehydrogenase